MYLCVWLAVACDSKALYVWLTCIAHIHKAPGLLTTPVLSVLHLCHEHGCRLFSQNRTLLRSPVQHIFHYLTYHVILSLRSNLPSGGVRLTLTLVSSICSVVVYVCAQQVGLTYCSLSVLLALLSAYMFSCNSVIYSVIPCDGWCFCVEILVVFIFSVVQVTSVTHSS